MTSFEHQGNDSLVRPEAIEELNAWCEKITDPATLEINQREQDLIASSALAHARMNREDEFVEFTENQSHIIGIVKVEK